MGIFSMVEKVKERDTRRLETGIMHETNFNGKVLVSFLYAIFLFFENFIHIYNVS